MVLVVMAHVACVLFMWVMFVPSKEERESMQRCIEWEASRSIDDRLDYT